MRKILVLSLLLASCTGQYNKSIEGRVSDGITGHGISSMVVMHDLQNPKCSIYTTSRMGGFTIDTRPSIYLMRVETPGYYPWQDTVHVTSDTTINPMLMRMSPESDPDMPSYIPAQHNNIEKNV